MAACWGGERWNEFLRIPFGRLLEGLGGEWTLGGSSVAIVTVIEKSLVCIMLGDGEGLIEFGVYL